jgi:hypothetical protein
VEGEVGLKEPWVEQELLEEEDLPLAVSLRACEHVFEDLEKF